MAEDPEKDRNLKERLARLLYAEGYSCRFNVDVVSEAATNADEMVGSAVFTDVDVMGCRFDNFLTRQIAIGDCKSGRSGTPRERLFWLSGLRDTFGAERAYFVKQRVDPTPFLVDFQRLGLGILSSETLQVLEAQNSVESLLDHGPVAEGAVDVWNRGLFEVKSHNRRAFRYLSAGYWTDEPGPQVEALIGIIRDLPAQAKFGRLAALSLLASSVLAISGQIAVAAPSQRIEAVLGAMSGANNISRRRRLLDSIHTFFVEEMKKQANVKWKVGKETFRSFLAPEFTPMLGDLIERVLMNPAARRLPQAFDCMAVATVDGAGEAQWAALTSQKVSYDGLLQGVGDVMAFAERASALTLDERRDLLSYAPEAS